MAEWIDENVLAVLHANPIEEITAKFTENFRRQHPDQDIHDLSLFERFTSLVTSDKSEIISPPSMTGDDKLTRLSYPRSPPDAKKLLHGFLSDLAFSPVACLIITGPHTNLENDIWSYLNRLVTTSVPYPAPRSFAPLLRMAATGATGVTIWRTLFDIFSALSTTGSSSASATISSSNYRSQTPVSSNSNSVTPGSEAHQVIDQRLRHELDGVLYPNVPGFFNAYFGDQQSPVVDNALQQAKLDHLSPSGWTTWPSPPVQDHVLNWFCSCVNALLPDSTTRRYTTSPNNPLPNAAAKRKPDVFLCARDSPLDWSNVLVVGELKQSNKDTLSPVSVVEFAGYIRLIFIAQHYRRFVHAFTLSGDMMRCWVFHRGGGTASERFSINANPERFLSVAVGYATMSNEDLGFDPTVTPPDDSGLRHIMLSGLRYDLKPKPFFVTSAIACRGTTCTEAKRPGDTEYNYVVKDAWRSDCYRSEGLLLLEAQAAGVPCLVEYIDHEDIHIDSVLDDITGNVMHGLDITGVKPLCLRPVEPRPTHNSRPPALGRLSTDPIPRPHSPAASRKRAHPTSLPLPPAKRNSLAPGTIHTHVSFNRVHTRLITSKGRPLYTFTTYLELLLALHGAITCHRALLRHGVLHRDISLTNILIPLSPRPDGARGLLLDLDLAVRLDATADATANHRTGTMQFMAIGTLSREPHTYRHDLESFFFVFLWLCVYYRPGGGRVKPYPTTLDSWGCGSYADAAARKSCDVEPGGFRRVVAGFAGGAGAMVVCARAWREALFPWRGLVWMGTDVDFERVYREVLEVIEEGVRAERGEV